MTQVQLPGAAKSVESLARSPLAAARAAYGGFIGRSNSPEMDKQTLRRSAEVIRRNNGDGGSATPLMLTDAELEPLRRELEAERAAVEEKAALLEQLRGQRSTDVTTRLAEQRANEMLTSFLQAEDEQARLISQFEKEWKDRIARFEQQAEDMEGMLKQRHEQEISKIQRALQKQLQYQYDHSGSATDVLVQAFEHHAKERTDLAEKIAEQRNALMREKSARYSRLLEKSRKTQLTLTKRLRSMPKLPPPLPLSAETIRMNGNNLKARGNNSRSGMRRHRPEALVLAQTNGSVDYLETPAIGPVLGSEEEFGESTFPTAIDFGGFSDDSGAGAMHRGQGWGDDGNNSSGGGEGGGGGADESGPFTTPKTHSTKARPTRRVSLPDAMMINLHQQQQQQQQQITSPPRLSVSSSTDANNRQLAIVPRAKNVATVNSSPQSQWSADIIAFGRNVVAGGGGGHEGISSILADARALTAQKPSPSGRKAVYSSAHLSHALISPIPGRHHGKHFLSGTGGSGSVFASPKRPQSDSSASFSKMAPMKKKGRESQLRQEQQQQQQAALSSSLDSALAARRQQQQQQLMAMSSPTGESSLLLSGGGGNGMNNRDGFAWQLLSGDPAASQQATTAALQAKYSKLESWIEEKIRVVLGDGGTRESLLQRKKSHGNLTDSRVMSAAEDDSGNNNNSGNNHNSSPANKQSGKGNNNSSNNNNRGQRSSNNEEEDGDGEREKNPDKNEDAEPKHVSVSNLLARLRSAIEEDATNTADQDDDFAPNASAALTQQQQQALALAAHNKGIVAMPVEERRRMQNKDIRKEVEQTAAPIAKAIPASCQTDDSYMGITVNPFGAAFSEYSTNRKAALRELENAPIGTTHREGVLEGGVPTTQRNTGGVTSRSHRHGLNSSRTHHTVDGSNNLSSIRPGRGGGGGDSRDDMRDGGVGDDDGDSQPASPSAGGGGRMGYNSPGIGPLSTNSPGGHLRSSRSSSKHHHLSSHRSEKRQSSNSNNGLYSPSPHMFDSRNSDTSAGFDDEDDDGMSTRSGRSARSARGGGGGHSSYDITDIFSCTRHNKPKALEALLDSGVPVDSRDSFGNTPLILACQNNHKRLTKICLRRGADINKQNFKGNTALHFATTYGYTALAKYLISKGADETLMNTDGLSALEGIKTVSSSSFG